MHVVKLLYTDAINKEILGEHIPGFARLGPLESNSGSRVKFVSFLAMLRSRRRIEVRVLLVRTDRAVLTTVVIGRNAAMRPRHRRLKVPAKYFVGREKE